MPLEGWDDPGEPDPGQPGTPRQPAENDAVRVAELETELRQVRDRWMRAEAEIANVRMRAKRDVDDARQYAVQSFATDVAGAAENLRRGLDSLPPSSATEPELITRLREGLVGVERSFVGVLERNGMKQEDPTGTAFDPGRHQAMAEEDDVAHPPGTVLRTWTPAWTLNGRLLRPAMVVVAKAPASQPSRPTHSSVQASA